MDRLAVRRDGIVIKRDHELFTFWGASPEQVADLCELWEGSVVEFSQCRGIVQVESDPHSIDLFCMVYETHKYLEDSRPDDMQSGDPGCYH